MTAANGVNGEPAIKKAKHCHGLDTVEVRCGEKVLQVALGTPVRDVLKDGEWTKAVAARMDNEVVSLSHPIVGSVVDLEPIQLASSDGIRTLVETLKFLLKIAKHECTPNLQITIGRPFGSAYFCMLADKDSESPHEPTEEELKKYQAAMSKAIESDLPFSYMTVATKNAIDNMSKTGAGFTSKMLKDSNAPQVRVVECSGMYHLPRHPVLSRTSMLPKDSFKLSKFKNGFFLEHYRYCSAKKEACFWQTTHDVLANDILYNEYMERQRWARAVELYTVQQLNEKIRSGNSKKVIQAVEANCDRQFVDMAAQIKDRPSVKLILIAGPSSSGKTTFAKRLQVQLESLGLKPEVLSVDNFYKGWPEIVGPSGSPSKVDWEALESLNLGQLNDVLLTLFAGKDAEIPEYDMKTSMPADKSNWTKMKLKQGGIVIMEGIHCLNPALTASVPKEQKFQITIAPIPALQLDATHVLSGTTIRMLRRMVRDYLNRGRPVLATLKQWPSIAAGEVNNIYPHQGNADAIMNSEIGYEVCVLKVHAEPLLKTIAPDVKEYSEVQRLLKTLDQFIALPTNVIPPQSLIREFVGGSWYYDYGGWYKSY